MIIEWQSNVAAFAGAHKYLNSFVIDGPISVTTASAAATEILALAHFNSLPGVEILAVGGLNGPGHGSMRAGADGAGLSWRAPNSPAYGAPIEFGGDVATRLLLDGQDSDKWVRVSVTRSRLPTGPTTADITLHDRWANEIGIEDLDASEATAGLVSTKTITLENQTANAGLVDSTNWLDPAAVAAGYEISFDNAAWHSPINEAEALAGIGMRTIAASATAFLYLRRTVAAGTSADPRATAVVYCSWDDGDSGRARSSQRGLYRVANAVEFRYYRSSTGKPQVGIDTPFATSPTLASTPTQTFADNVWQLGVTEFNGFIESEMRRFDRLEVESSAQVATSPAAPLFQSLTERAGGVPRIKATYSSGVEPAGVAADTWAIWFTMNGVDPDPDVDAADSTETMVFNDGVASLQTDLGAQANATDVRMIVRSRRLAASADSPNTSILQLTIATAGPSTALGGAFTSDNPPSL